MRQLEKEYLSIIIQQFEHFKDRAELAFTNGKVLYWKPNGRIEQYRNNNKAY